jgi:hypothetical protein
MPNYYLRRDVHYCQVDDGVIFLDLEQGTYLGLGLAEATALQAIVHGWPRHPSQFVQSPAGTSNDVMLIAETLMQKGLLTSDATQAGHATPASLEYLAETEISDPTAVIPAIHARDIVNVVVAVVVAALKLRWLPFHRIVRGVEQRKSCALRHQLPDEEQTIRSLVRVFRRLRTLIYTDNNQCLYDSLVLLEFLHRYDLYPTWVIGVHTRPFAAHSWLQHRAFVLNESPDAAREYIPILVV